MDYLFLRKILQTYLCVGWVRQNHPDFMDEETDIFPVSDSLGKEARNDKSQKGVA